MLFGSESGEAGILTFRVISNLIFAKEFLTAVLASCKLKETLEKPEVGTLTQQYVYMESYHHITGPDDINIRCRCRL